MNLIKKIKQFRERMSRIDVCSIPEGSTVTLCASIDDEAFQESVEDDFFSCEEPPESHTVYKDAEGLPQGWMWVHYDDRSGGLNSPDGNSFYHYDMNTQEYRFNEEYRYCFMENYEFGYVARLDDFTEFAEKEMAELIKEVGRLFHESEENGLSTLRELINEAAKNNVSFFHTTQSCQYIMTLLNNLAYFHGLDCKLSELAVLTQIPSSKRAAEIEYTFHMDTDPSELWCQYSIYENGQKVSRGYTSVDYDEWLSYGSDEDRQNQFLLSHIRTISQKEKIDLSACSKIMRLCIRYIEWSDSGICDFTFRELMEKDMSRDDFEAFDSDISNMDLGTDINVPRSLTDIYDSLPADSEEGYDNVIIECNPGLLDYFEFANISDE